MANSSYVAVDPRVLSDLVVWSARHGKAVEEVVSEAVVLYMLDVDVGLMVDPPPTPRYWTRLRQRAG